MSLKVNKVTEIRYTKRLYSKQTEEQLDELHESTKRFIIPTTVPGNIKAIDATDLFPVQRTELAEFYNEYSAYLKNHMKQAFSFEDWLSHTKDVQFTPKWRTFKTNQTEIIT